MAVGLGKVDRTGQCASQRAEARTEKPRGCARRHAVSPGSVKLFLAGTSLRPAYGGPAYSVSRLAIALTKAGVQVGLWAPDQSVATTPLLTAGSPVQRLTGSVIEALDQFGKPDVLHDNGIWLTHNHRLA